MAVLGILSDCCSSRDLEDFAERHREVLNQALGLNFKRWPCDATRQRLDRGADHHDDQAQRQAERQPPSLWPPAD